MARYYHGVDTYEAFVEFVREKIEAGFIVKDEYGHTHIAEQFLSDIPKRKGSKCHACEYPSREYWNGHQMHDHEHGISFHDYEFS